MGYGIEVAPNCTHWTFFLFMIFIEKSENCLNLIDMFRHIAPIFFGEKNHDYSNNFPKNNHWVGTILLRPFMDCAWLKKVHKPQKLTYFKSQRILFLWVYSYRPPIFESFKFRITPCNRLMTNHSVWNRLEIEIIRRVRANQNIMSRLLPLSRFR